MKDPNHLNASTVMNQPIKLPTNSLEESITLLKVKSMKSVIPLGVPKTLKSVSSVRDPLLKFLENTLAVFMMWLDKVNSMLSVERHGKSLNKLLYHLPLTVTVTDWT